MHDAPRALTGMPGVRTTCPYCGVGCGVIVVSSDSATEVTGDAEHPSNYGRLCSKGAALAQTIDLDGRVLSPTIIDHASSPAEHLAVTWDEALERVAQAFSSTIRKYGRDSVALYVSGQLLTEDYYVANKLVKGWFGTANIDTNSRLCMASAVAGHKRAFGEDIVSCSYEDLELADLIVLVGSNTAWCHPVIYQRIMAARAARSTDSPLRLIVIDPRRTPACEHADLHLPLRSGADGALFNGLLTYLANSDARDPRFIAEETSGISDALAAARDGSDLGTLATTCGVSTTQLLEFFGLFAATPRVVTLFSQGINQSSSGSDKVNAIINCHLITGRINQPGAGPFSITGQPNAMGGREVGGLANTLAAHLDLDNPLHRQTVQQFWNSPHVASEAGPKAVEMFEAVASGKIRAIWIIATNPVVSLPMANRVRDALRHCDFVVVSDCIADTDTARLAHVLLPAAAWGEKDGTVTNSERRISRQRSFLALPGLAQPDWWAICQVAKRMGFSEGFNFTSAHEIFLEHARLSAQDNEPTGPQPRLFDIGGLANLSRQDYDDLTPVRWPVLVHGKTSTRFLPGARRARFIPIHPKPPAYACSSDYPFILNTGRVRDQWHTMTRTGKAPRLNAHRPEPYVEVHPHDLLSHGLKDGELAAITSAWGSVVVRVQESADQLPGSLFVPIHWSDANASDARVGAVVNPVVDPISGEPEFKHTPVRIEPFPVAWYGFALSRRVLDLELATYWARSAGQQHVRYELAGRGPASDWSRWVMDQQGADDEWLDYSDVGSGTFRAARIVNQQLDLCIFISLRTDLPEREWLASLFAKGPLETDDRRALLAGRASVGSDGGPTVCACFGVGRKTIERAIVCGARTTAELGSSLKAGTNCGSCLPELRRIIETHSPEQRTSQAA